MKENEKKDVAKKKNTQAQKVTPKANVPAKPQQPAPAPDSSKKKKKKKNKAQVQQQPVVNKPVEQPKKEVQPVQPEQPIKQLEPVKKEPVDIFANAPAAPIIKNVKQEEAKVEETKPTSEHSSAIVLEKQPEINKEIERQPEPVKTEPTMEDYMPKEQKQSNKGVIFFGIFSLAIIGIGLYAIISLTSNREFWDSFTTTADTSTTTTSIVTTEWVTTTTANPATIVEEINYGSTIGTVVDFVKEQKNGKTTYRTNFINSVGKYSDYTCKTGNCAVFEVSSNGKYTVIYDNNKYFLYDIYAKKNARDLKLPKRNYSEIQVYNASNGNVGLILKPKAGGVGYYDATKNKLLLNFYAYNFITTYDFLFNRGLVLLYSYNVKQYYLYDVFNVKVRKDDISHVIYCNNCNDYYFDNVNLYSSKTSATIIYDKNLNKIYEGNGIYLNNIIFDHDELFMYDNKNIYVYKNSKLVRKSQDYKKLFFANKQYMLIYDRNDISLVDSNNKIIKDITTYRNSMNVSNVKIQDNTVSFVVKDNDYSCDKIDEEKANFLLEGASKERSDSAFNIVNRCKSGNYETKITFTYNMKTGVVTKIVGTEKITK